MRTRLRRDPCGYARSAFTLVEMVISIVILALIFGACMSVIMLSTRARGTEASTDLTERTTETRAAVDQIVAELKSAVSISSRTATSIMFYVPDRDGDGDQEWISYYVMGNVLYRYYNSIFPDVFLRNVSGIDFTYLDKVATTLTPVEGAEQLLMSFTTTPNALTALSTTAWEAQYFKPSAIMPANAVSWKVTRVEFYMKKASSSSTGSVFVEIRPAASTLKPATGAITTGTLAVSGMSTSNTWVGIPLSTSVGDLAPTQGISLVVRSDRSPSNATINGCISISPATVNQAETDSTTGGTSWNSPSGSACLNYKVYGTITTLQ